MAKYLQRKFIIIAMSAVTIVMVVILGGINLVNFKSVRNYADSVLIKLAANGGTFDGMKGFVEHNDGMILGGNRITNETPFETRYFSVRYDDAANIAIIDTSHIAAVDASEARDYAEDVLVKGKTKGSIDCYRYLVTATDKGTMILFMDCSNQRATAGAFLSLSVMFALCALMAIFILLIVMSKRALKPIIQSYEKQKSFVTDASHELKTPLTIISANNELIEMDYGESESTRAITKQVARLATMTKNLTMLAKIDENSVSREKTKFSFSDTVLDVAMPYKALAETAGGKTLELAVADNIEFVGDENLIRQMFTLMLDNAIKYGKSYIKLTVTKVKKQIFVDIRNDAENVSDGNHEEYFERFFRSGESRASGIEGSGIGLSIVKEIVELHKGKISADGKDGEFIISITL